MFVPAKSGTKSESSCVKLYTEADAVPLVNSLSSVFATSCNITLTTPPVSQKLCRDTASLLLSSCDRETDILSDDFDVDLIKEEETNITNKSTEINEVMEVDSAKEMTNEVGFHKPYPVVDDPLLMDDIAKSISALDDVIALFDDTSLPYLNEEDGVLNCNDVRSPAGITGKAPLPDDDDAEDSSCKIVHTSDFHRVQEDITNCNRFTSQFSTELLVGPFGTGGRGGVVAATTGTTPSDPIYSNKFLSHSSSTASSSSSSTGSSKGGVPNNNNNNVKKSRSQFQEDCGSGTYSKGTGFEIRNLPKVIPPPQSFAEDTKEGAEKDAGHSSKTVKSSRPQLSRGVFTSSSRASNGEVPNIPVTIRGGEAPEEPEVDYNDTVLETSENNNGGSVSKAIVGVSSGGSKEQWNFPSEKNLPRSLRKTRKTCLIEDEEGKGEVSLLSSADTISSSSCSQSSMSRSERNHPVNNKMREDEHQVVLLPAPRKSVSRNNHNSTNGVVVARGASSCSTDNYSNASYSSSSSLSFNNSLSEGNNHAPKPKVRQQIPSQTTTPPPPPLSLSSSSASVPVHSPSMEKVIVGGQPKPVCRNKEGKVSPTPLSHEVEMSRVGRATKTFVDISMSPEVPEGEEVVGIVVGGGAKGKKKGRISLTGSGSSISRSSSSSSGGDPNYFYGLHKKDHNLSSSSGVVLTSSSSTGSPTNSSSIGIISGHHSPKTKDSNVTVICTGGNNNNTMDRVVEVVKRRSVSSVPVGGGGGQNKNKPGSFGGRETGERGGGGGGVLEVDDGYLSMINRNEAPLLWPEEFIENETFSPDELRRLSVHLGGTEEEFEDSDEEEFQQRRRREASEIELEIVEYDREPSRRVKPVIGGGGIVLQEVSRRSSGKKNKDSNKTDYFSDDSLEGGESEESLEGNINKQRREPFGNKKKSMGNGGGVSRIPKMVGPSPMTSSSTPSPAREEKPRKKPCSFFVSLSEGASEVTSSSTTSSREEKSSPSKGLPVSVLRVGEVFEGKKSVTNNTTHGESHVTTSDTNKLLENKVNVVGNVSKIPVVVVNTNVTTTSNCSSSGSVRNNNNAKKLSSLPQLRHTKSINVGGPREGAAGIGGGRWGELNNTSDKEANNNNNLKANKRKSTSDLVVETKKEDEDRTSSFNRSGTFLIPSRKSAKDGAEVVVEDLVVNGKKDGDHDGGGGGGEDNDETEDDLSLSCDLEDGAVSLGDDGTDVGHQPLSIEELRDFVSEIMDTAIRHRLTQDANNLNDYDDDDDDDISTDEAVKQQQQTNLNHISQVALLTSSTQLPEHSHYESTEKRKSSRECGLLMREIEGDEEEHFDSLCPTRDDEEQEETLFLENETTTTTSTASMKKVSELLAEQLDAVVTNFLSDNESFLQKEEDEDGEAEVKRSEEEVIKSESQEDVLSDATSVSHADDAMKPEACVVGGQGALMRDSSLLGEERILDDDGDEVEVEEVEDDEEEEEECPPAFIPTPPPKLPEIKRREEEEVEEEIVQQRIPPSSSAKIIMAALPLKNEKMNYLSETRFGKKFTNNNSSNLLHHQNSNVKDGKAALDLLAERISNSKKFSSPDEQQLAVSHFVHDKRNIWGWYDRPYEYDEDLLTVNAGGVRGYASRSQENLVDAMTKERFQKSFSTRGQSSTLPLNCRPPTTQRRSSTFRNMFNKFRRNKQTESSMKEIGEYQGDDEVQSITSRETGTSETSKKRGFFSRLFRRSKKH